MNDAIIQRIQKLLAMTTERGCTPAEAAHAAAKAQEFMQRYGLSMFDVEAKTYGEKVEEEHRDLEFERVPAWVCKMAGAVARPNGCEYVLSWIRRGKRRTNCLKFIGHTTDVKIVAYLYQSLSKALWRQSAGDCKQLGRGGASLAKARWDYMRGAACAIEQRLTEEAKRFEQSAGSAIEPFASGPAVNGAMVLVKNKAVEEYMAKEFPDLKTVHHRGSPRDHAAEQAGIAAGRSIPIRKGLERGEAQGLIE